MPVLLDTGVAILMRDGTHSSDLLARLPAPAFLSIVSRVELENGVYRESDVMPLRRAALDRILQTVHTLAFDEVELGAYRAIVAEFGYSRRKTLDRMIAATALANGLTLATTNSLDFREISQLEIVEIAS